MENKATPLSRWSRRGRCRRGHVAVEGRLASYEYFDDWGPHLHMVEFGFKFDPTTLPAILAAGTEWLAPKR